MLLHMPNAIRVEFPPTGRFKTHHVIIGHLFTAPLSFMFVGLGGAIVKYRMVMRGEASQDLYMPFIWAGLILTIVLFLAQVNPAVPTESLPSLCSPV